MKYWNQFFKSKKKKKKKSVVRPLTEKKVQVVDKQHVVHDVIYYNAFNRIKSLSHERERDDLENKRFM